MTGIARSARISEVRMDAEPVLIRIPLGRSRIPFPVCAECGMQSGRYPDRRNDRGHSHG